MPKASVVPILYSVPVRVHCRVLYSVAPCHVSVLLSVTRTPPKINPPYRSKPHHREKGKAASRGRPRGENSDSGRLCCGFGTVHAVPARAHVGATGGRIHPDDPRGAAASDLEELEAEAHRRAGDTDGVSGLPRIFRPRGHHHRGMCLMTLFCYVCTLSSPAAVIPHVCTCCC